MKMLRYATVLSGLVILLFAIGFIFQIQFATNLWPWQDGRYSYLFIGSILAAVSAAAIWIGWTGEFGALPAGSLNIFVIAVTASVYFFQLARNGRPELLPFGVAGLVSAVVSGAAFLWSRRLPLSEARPTPTLVKVSFGIFVASLIFAGGALIFRLPIFPWKLNPDSSVIFGCIFLGDAFYFLYGLFRPRWHNARGQLLSFLAYDLVLIVPFLGPIPTVESASLISLIVYVAVLVYSGALAVYYLFINPQTRFGS
ncbi:MAG: hypothetical protein C4583_15855 [Anaerolineaceae bacterium]|nr:MAG: hypothetical protein C4583_15855 [Anaerolineaceae bacterium]